MVKILGIIMIAIGIVVASGLRGLATFLILCFGGVAIHFCLNALDRRLRSIPGNTTKEKIIFWFNSK